MQRGRVLCTGDGEDGEVARRRAEGERSRRRIGEKRDPVVGRRRDSLVLGLSQAKYSTGGVASIIIIAGAGVEEVVWSGEGAGDRDRDRVPGPLC